MTTPGPVAKATDPATAPAAPQASSGAPGAAPQGGGSPARAMQAPAVKDTLGPAEGSNGTGPAPAAPATAPAAKESVKEPAKEPAAPAAKEAPAPAPAAAAKEQPKDVPAPAPAAPAAKETPAPAPAPTVKETSVPKPAPAPAVKESIKESSATGGSGSTATKTAPPKPARTTSEAPVPKSKLGRTRGTAGVVPPPRVRRARLKIANIDPWSVMKVSFLFSVALGIILLVAVTLLWVLLDFMGFFATVAGTIEDISKDANGGGFDVVAFFSLPRVLGMTTIVALIDIILITALATLAAYLYNLSTDLVGGVEVTLAEEE